MRKIYIDQLKGTEVISKNIYDESGRILLSAGAVIKPFYIKKLQQMDIFAVYVKDDYSKGIEVEEFISEELRNRSKKILREDMQKLIGGNEGMPASILKSTGDIIDEILSKKEIMINIIDIRSKKDEIFSHVVNVCALSVITAIHMGYNMLKIKEVAIGALLHDVGKLKVPKDILNKSGTLTQKEEQILKKHPKDSYEILNKQQNISATAKVMALLHHEREDGSGYPLGFKGDKIHETAKILAVCDTFDHMTADVGKKRGMKPYEVVDYLLAVAGVQFDKSVVEVFLKNISLYPPGSGVILNTGQKGIVVEVHKGVPTRPIVRLIYDEEGQKISPAKVIDLLKERTVFITETKDVLMFDD